MNPIPYIEKVILKHSFICKSITEMNIDGSYKFDFIMLCFYDEKMNIKIKKDLFKLDYITLIKFDKSKDNNLIIHIESKILINK